MAHSDVDVGQRELHAMSEALNQGLTQRGGDSSAATPSATTAPALFSAGRVEGGGSAGGAGSGSLLAPQVPPHCSPLCSSCRSGCLEHLAASMRRRHTEMHGVSASN